MVGMFVCLCLASKNSSEREVFVPTRTDLAVKLLNPLMVALDKFAESHQPLQRHGCVCVVSDL